MICGCIKNAGRAPRPSPASQMWLVIARLRVAHKLIQTQAVGLREDPMTPFGTWLAEIGLGRYDDVFVSNGIDFDVIRSLTTRCGFSAGSFPPVRCWDR
jgi:hypothetical protein